MGAIQVTWTDSRHIAVQLDFPDEWIWDDLYVAHDDVYNLARTVPHTVDLVYATGGLRTLPKNYFRQLRIIADKYPENYGLVIWTECHRLTIEMIRGMARNYPDLAQRYAFADTLTEAYRYIGP